MNYGKTMKWGGISLCTLMVAVAFAMPANATSGAAPAVDESNGAPRAYIIVNAGVIGDTWGISCELTDGYIEYHVELDRNNNHDPTDTANPGNGYDYRVSGDAGDLTPDSDTCIGGAVGPFDIGQFDPLTTKYAHVKLTDYVFGGCADSADRCGENLLIPEDTTVQDALDSYPGLGEGTVSWNPSGLFRVQAQMTADNANDDPSCLSPVEVVGGVPTVGNDDTMGNQQNPDVCQRANDVTATRNYMAMGFCGEGYTTLVDINDDDASPLAWSAPEAGAQLFADSPALGLLDCFLDANPVVNDCTPGPCYAQVANLINTLVTCNHDDSDNIPDTVCIFEDLPAFVACNDLLTTAPGGVPMFQIVGEGGWEITGGTGGHCVNAGNTDEDWVEGAGTTIFIDGGSELNPVIDQVQDVADMVDFCAAFSLDGESCRDGPL